MNQFNMAHEEETLASRDPIVLAYAFCMFLLIPTLVMASKGLAVIFAVLAVISLIDLLWRGDVRRLRLNAGLWLYLSLLLVALLSTLWSIEPGLSLRSAAHQSLYWVGLVLLLQSVRRMDGAAAQRILAAVRLSLIPTVVFVAIEGTTDFALSMALRGVTKDMLNDVNIYALLNTGWSGLAMLIWPLVAFAFVRGQKILGIAIVAGTYFAASLGDSTAAVLALGVATALFLVLRVWRSAVVPVVMAAGFATFLMAAPFVAQQLDRTEVSDIPLGHWLQDFPHSTYHRFLIISFAGERIAERPWTGFGMNSSRVIPGGSEVIHGWREVATEGANGAPVTSRIETFNVNVLPLHPHNISLQLWLELGPMAALLVVFMVGAVVRRCHALPSAEVRAGTLASLGAWMVNSALSFGMWQHWWVSLGVITVTVWAMTLKAQKAEKSSTEN